MFYHMSAPLYRERRAKIDNYDAIRLPMKNSPDRGLRSSPHLDPDLG